VVPAFYIGWRGRRKGVEAVGGRHTSGHHYGQVEALVRDRFRERKRWGRCPSECGALKRGQWGVEEARGRGRGAGVRLWPAARRKGAGGR
jgi:hypothetical protein